MGEWFVIGRSFREGMVVVMKAVETRKTNKVLTEICIVLGEVAM